MTKAAAMTAAILEGVFDEDLEAISEAVHTRRRYLNRQRGLTNLVTIKAGAKVMTHGLSPKYLNGQIGVVLDEPARRGGDMQVEFPYPLGRYGKKIGIPAGCLQLVAS